MQMAQTIQFRRGNENNLPSLAPGEPAVTLDTDKLFVGGPNGNIEVTKKDELKDIAVSIKAYKNLALNIGQSNEDWAPALRQAMSDYTKVYFPRGTYRMGVVSLDPTLSGRTIYGDGDDTVINPFNGNLFNISGTFGTEQNITANLTDFTNTIPVTDGTQFAAGDFILLKGQRDALNETDSGESWTLGYATPAAQGLFFGEYLEVKSVSGNTITTKTRTIFPGYRMDKTLETSVNARACTTVQKVTFTKDVIFRDFKVLKKSGYAFYFNRAYNCLVDNVSMVGDGYLNESYLSHTFFNNSLNCESRFCKFRINHDVAPVNYYDLNVYKAVGSTNCGFFKCYAYNTGQNVDITYNAGATPAINCYVDYCVFENATQSGMTSHGGTHQTRFSNNTIRGCRQGIANRSRNAIITNNVLIGYTEVTPNDLHYGIGMYEGYAVDCIIANNTIIGFYTGIGVFDATDVGECFKYTGAIVANNTIKNFMYGFRVYKNTNRKIFADMGIKVLGNTFHTSNAQNSIGVRLDQYTKGVTIKDNNFTGGTGGAPTGRAIWGDYDVSNVRIIGNTIRNMSTGIFLRGNSDTATTGGVLVYDRFLNDFQNVTLETTIAAAYTKVDREH
jgi:Major tropism determinant N-terminal domain